MEDGKKSLVNAVAAAGYDAGEKPFDFISAGTETALVCEADPAIKEKITKALKNMDYQVTEPVTGREALKSMRFHSYDLVVVNEKFDGTDNETSSNEVLYYLQNLAAAARRNIFVALLSDNYRTMYYMMAFNNSVNMVINKKNIDDFATIIQRGLADNQAFYGIFKEALKKLGRV